MSPTMMFTTRDSVPVRSGTYASSAQVRLIVRSGQSVTVNAFTYNSNGNRWYRLTDGNWIYSGNLRRNITIQPPTHPPVINNNQQNVTTMTQRTFFTTRDNVPVRPRQYEASGQVRLIARRGQSVTVNAFTLNSHGNRWYRLTDGNWIYSGNLTPQAPPPTPQAPTQPPPNNNQNQQSNLGTATIRYNANGGTGTP